MKMDVRSLKKNIAVMEDPRRCYGNLRHMFETIVVIGLLTFLCGGKDYSDMEELGIAKYEWLSGFLEFPNGVPDSDTFRRVFERIDCSELHNCLNKWLEYEKDKVKTVAIDGKTICGSVGAGHRALHVVSAWASECGITLGQVAVDEKSNEITAIPELLEVIDIRGSVVTIDAMGCQTAIAEAIRSKEADYLLALKSNHKTFYKEAIKAFNAINADDTYCALDTYSECNNDHGRIETRTVTVISAEGVNGFDKWKDIRTIIRCMYTSVKDGKKSTCERYFISSLPANARRIANTIRKHWSIENNLHWVLDVVFEEDASRAKKNNSPQNLNILRKIALTMLSRVKSGRESYKKIMFRAAMSSDFLELVVFG